MSNLRRGFKLISPSPPGVWGPDRPVVERFPVDAMGEEWAMPMDERDTVPPVRDSRGAWLLDGGQWQALRAAESAPELEPATYADPAPTVTPRRGHEAPNAAARDRLNELARLGRSLRALRPW